MKVGQVEKKCIFDFFFQLKTFLSSSSSSGF